MKTFRLLITAGAAAVSLLCPRAVFADSTATPVPQDRDDKDLLRDLRGVPAPVKDLILNFDQQRDQYLQEQRKLLIELKHATTAQEREALRDQLQANRQEFLADLKSFRQQLKTDLTQLQGKISHAELLRILDAAKDAGGGPRHKGK